MITGQSFIPPTKKHAGWLCANSLVYVAYAYTYWTAVREIPAGKMIILIDRYKD